MPLPVSEGKQVPEVTFLTKTDKGLEPRDSKDIFKGRTVIVFGLPGAFTPTCSSTHVPGYNDLFPTFKANGVDEIVCVSVNDPFVMNAWAADKHADNITFMADGNTDFTNGLGLLVDKSQLGFGKRSWRYSMLVKDGKIEKQFNEPEKPGDPFEVSDAGTMLKYIAPNAKSVPFVTLVGKQGCSFCAKARELLKKNNQPFEEIDLSDTVTTKTLRALAGPEKDTTPQIFFDGKLIGGADDLEKYYSK